MQTKVLTTLSFHARIFGGWGPGGGWTPTAQAISFLRKMCPNRLGNHKVTKPAFNVGPLSAPFGKVRHNHGSGVWRSITRGTMYQNAHFISRCKSLSCLPPLPGQLAQGASCPGIPCSPPWLSTPPGGKLYQL